MCIRDRHGCVLLVTADHGNADEMLQKNKKGELQPRTAHSLNPVPFIICDDEPHALKDGKFGLANVAPTVAQLLGEVEMKASRTLVLEPGAYPPALVLANFREKDLDTLLDLMKQAQVNIPLKAVVTPSNKNWVFGDLLAHLSEEHATFTAAAKEQA
mgnify:FL=1